jgi:rRNA maturation endonuclease Nob1
MSFDKASSDNLKEYYKFVYNCRVCNRKYGSDLKEKKGLCPICFEKFRKGEFKI